VATETALAFSSEVDPAHAKKMRIPGRREPVPWKRRALASEEDLVASWRERLPGVSRRPTFRFAPSPNGPLHLGHAYSALLNHELARRSGGRFLLRIEDIDTVRCREDLVEKVFEDLRWLGLDWEDVPRQSTRFGAYAEALGKLSRQGLLYASAASRKAAAEAVASIERDLRQAWPRDPEGVPLHPARRLGEGNGGGSPDIVAGVALRLDMESALTAAPDLTWVELGCGPDGETGLVPARPGIWGDVVLARKDIPASYHLAVVVDDAAQGVTDVVRGQDLFHSTSIHRLLQYHLGLPAPRYHHHRLVRGGGGEKLSKSLASRSLASFREEGMTPADVRRLVGI
jgi:glutamyl-Q tRNA(Asp) synthetase